MRLFLRLLTLVVRLSTARSQSYPQCEEEEDDILEEHELNTQLLQVSHALHRGPISGDFWDLQAILADSPRGTFLSRMGVLVQAVTLTYTTSLPLDNTSTSTANAGDAGFSVDGSKWERLHEFDRDPTPGGVFARVFVDRESKAGVVVFKGICTNPHLEQCQIDQCYLIRIQNYGLLSSTVARLSGFSPETCAQHQQYLDYTAQANQFIHQVQTALPDYQLLLTGHSLGGMLGIVTAAQQPKLLKALTFAPTPFNVVMKQELNFSQEQIRALPVNQLVATCDPYDCGINAVYAQQARAGSETCLYLHTEEPPPCQGLVLPYGSETWREQVNSRGPNSTNITAAIPELLCKGSAHRWRRYVDIVLRRNSQGRPANLPVCSTDFSVLETALQAAR